MIDARRISDNKLVRIKRVHTGDTESTTLKWFSRNSVQSEKNHCPAVLDLFRDPMDPSLSFVVIPFLRHFDSPSLQTVQDAIDLIHQVLEVKSVASPSYQLADGSVHRA